MLVRARRQRLECGLLMLRWLDQTPSPDELSDPKRSTALSRIGEILRRAARDMDTVVRYDEYQFLMLLEGPVSRTAVSEISTKILADCIRLADKLDDPHAVNLHVAIWHDMPGKQTGQPIINSLKARLNRMASGPTRYVQFVDSAGEPENIPAEDSTRREELVAKINAIETSHPTLTREQLPPLRAPLP